MAPVHGKAAGVSPLLPHLPGQRQDLRGGQGDAAGHQLRFVPLKPYGKIPGLMDGLVVEGQEGLLVGVKIVLLGQHAVIVQNQPDHHLGLPGDGMRGGPVDKPHHQADDQQQHQGGAPQEFSL